MRAGYPRLITAKPPFAVRREVCRRARPGTLSREEVRDGGSLRTAYEQHPVTPEPSRDGWVGYAAIKYTAIVIIVLAILGFLAWYVLPKIG